MGEGLYRFVRGDRAKTRERKKRGAPIIVFGRTWNGAFFTFCGDPSAVGIAPGTDIDTFGRDNTTDNYSRCAPIPIKGVHSRVFHKTVQIQPGLLFNRIPVDPSSQVGRVEAVAVVVQAGVADGGVGVEAGVFGVQVLGGEAEDKKK
jgi:hypothetical protein